MWFKNICGEKVLLLSTRSLHLSDILIHVRVLFRHCLCKVGSSFPGHIVLISIFFFSLWKALHAFPGLTVMSVRSGFCRLSLLFKYINTYTAFNLLTTISFCIICLTMYFWSLYHWCWLSSGFLNRLFLSIIYFLICLKLSVSSPNQ